MTVHAVRELTHADTERWTTFVREHPEARLYHSLTWRDVLVEAFGPTPVYLVAERDGVVRGVLPLLMTSLPVVGRKLTSLPYDAGSGGPLAVDPAASAALLEAAIARAHALGVRYLEVRCDRPRPEFAGLPLETREPLLITDVSLDGSEDVFRRVKSDQRRSAGAAARRGVEVRRAETLGDVRRFYEMYCRVFRSMGTPPYGWRYFRTVWRRLGESGGAVVHLAEVEGTCIGGSLLYCGGRHVVAKFILSLPSAAQYRAAAALFDRALRHAHGIGATTLSWGTSAPQQTGLVEFKERWAGETRPVVVYGHAVRAPLPRIEDLYDANTPVRRAWRRLPLTVTKVGGAVLNRWFC